MDHPAWLRHLVTLRFAPRQKHRRKKQRRRGLDHGDSVMGTEGLWGMAEEGLLLMEEVKAFTYKHVHEQVFQRHLKVLQFGS